MGFQVAFSIRENKITALPYISAGLDGQAICSNAYILEATYVGDISKHTLLWEQISGPPVNWVTPLNETTAAFTIPPGQYQDRVFRIYVDKGTYLEKYDDVIVFGTPTSRVNLGIPRSTEDQISISTGPTIGDAIPTLVYFRGTDAEMEQGKSQYDIMCTSCI